MFQAIPNLSKLRQEKNGYDTRFEIDTEHPLHNDPLVDPRESEFGFDDAESYYAKMMPIPNAPLLRLDVARRLKMADFLLRTDKEVREALGAPARIKIDDALRAYEAQEYGYEVYWPKRIREQHPEYMDKEIPEDILKQNIAKPADHPTPTPHLTGGAVDVALYNVETNEAFDRGHKGGGVAGTAYPDFHEGYHLTEGQSDIKNVEGQQKVAEMGKGREIVMSRRVLYWAMTEAGLYVNPTEIWHYGKGDPLSEHVSGSNHPYYGVAKLPDWYKAEMERLEN